MNRTPYYLRDEQNNNFISFQYTGMNSTSLRFKEVDSIKDASGFKYDDNAERYAQFYFNSTGRKAVIHEELK